MKKVILGSISPWSKTNVEMFDSGWLSHWACLNLKSIYMKRILVEEYGYISVPIWDHDRWRDTRGSGGSGLGQSGFDEPPKFDKDVDVFVLFEQPHRVNMDDIEELKSEHPNAIFILIVLGDYRFWRRHYNHHKRVLEVFDILFDWQFHHYTNKGDFNTVFPEYSDKHVFFPHCFVPHENWVSIRYNETPKMKCLFTGRVGNRYDIRNQFLKKVLVDRKLEEITDLCKDFRAKRYLKRTCSYYHDLPFFNTNQIVKDDYISLINDHFCSIVGSTFRKHLLGKFFEYPAGGSLLIADRFKDLDQAGFIPGVHYVEITINNVADVVKDVIENSDQYEHIRKAGFEFVRANHNINVRMEFFNKKIQEVFNE